MFHVGQKVVCIHGCPSSNPLPHCVKGKIYTVANVYIIDDLTMIELFELPFPGLVDADGEWMPGFVAECFRPVVERKTDISIFTAMLNKKPEQVTA
jgi:hypothetical protein